MRIAILDDVKADRDLLGAFLKNYLDENHIDAEIILFTDSKNFFAECTTFDMVFLDIFMNGENGMDIAVELRESNYHGNIIFVTSSKDFAIDGYKVQACGYIVKPYDYDQLKKAMDTCQKDWNKEKDYIKVKEGRVMVKIRLKDILYSDYYNHYIQIHTKQHLYRTYLSFADFSKQLSPYPNFLSCYRNVIVNLEYVSSMEPKDFVMKDSCRIPIAKAKRQEVRQAYADYLFTQLSEK